MSKKSGKQSHSLQIPKSIVLTAKFLQFISPNLAALFAARLFTTPLKHKIPKRELEMDRKSSQKRVDIKSIGKQVVVYQYGDSDKKILLVHGWSGRGTQLVKFADELIKQGYATISFDAPAHGKSSGKRTLMPEFIATILQMEKEFGPFYAAVGHSLGGMSLLNSVQQGLQIQRLVAIGSGDVVKDIMDEFIEKLQLRGEVSDIMRNHFEKTSSQTMHSYSSYIAAKEIDIPVLIIHDNDDQEVSVKCAHHIFEQLKNGELMVTDGLGHRKILGHHSVVAKTLQFIKK